jgi:hypothetical protein
MSKERMPEHKSLEDVDCIGGFAEQHDTYIQCSICHVEIGVPKSAWALYQLDDPDYECETDRLKDTAEEWLVEFDKGSDAEDCPHSLEAVHGTVVYRILTVSGVHCCNVRDTTKTCLSPTKLDPNRWVEGEPTAVTETEKPDNVIKFPG